MHLSTAIKVRVYSYSPIEVTQLLLLESAVTTADLVVATGDSGPGETDVPPSTRYRGTPHPRRCRCSMMTIVLVVLSVTP